MIKIIQGDIRTLAVDAIVNAAKIAVRDVDEFLTQRRDVPASQASGCLSEANLKGRTWPRDTEEMEVIFCCFSERDKNVYENLTCATETLDMSRNAARKYL